MFPSMLDTHANGLATDLALGRGHAYKFSPVICPINELSRVLIMLVAYFDASKTQLGRSYVAVVGCLAHLDQWRLFQPEWQNILDEEGLEFFYMTDFEAYEIAYKGWNLSSHHDSRLLALAVGGGSVRIGAFQI